MRIIISLMFLCMIAVSCEKEINIDFAENERKITINAEIKEDSVIQVHVSKSAGILERDSEASDLSDAEVLLYENNTLIEKLIYKDQGVYMATTKAKPHVTYEVKVNHAIYPSASAKTTMPSKIEIQKIDTLTKTVSDGMNSYMALHHRITFTDPANEDNYYALFAYTTYMEYVYDYITYNIIDSIERKEQVYISSADLIVDKDMINSNYLLFNDNVINGKKYAFECLVNGYYGYEDYGYGMNKNQYQFVLKSISKELYLYLLSKQKNANIAKNPFAEPVTVYNNIENGFGILGSSTFSIKDY